MLLVVTWGLFLADELHLLVCMIIFCLFWRPERRLCIVYCNLARGVGWFMCVYVLERLLVLCMQLCNNCFVHVLCCFSIKSVYMFWIICSCTVWFVKWCSQKWIKFWNIWDDAVEFEIVKNQVMCLGFFLFSDLGVFVRYSCCFTV